MVKLIAKRPIQYMGRIYERGEPVPAYDTGMVEAWLRAGSAEWTGRKPPDAPQDAVDGGGGQEPAGAGNGTQGGLQPPEGHENDAPAGEPEMVTGHMDAADLAKWKKADLEKLAADMGVDISTAKNNAERAAILAAVEVQAPANSPDNDGGAQ